MADHDGHTINVGPVTVGIDTEPLRMHYGPHHDVSSLCDEVDRLRMVEAVILNYEREQIEAHRRRRDAEAEVDRLRAALEEEFDFDHLPIPRFVNYLIDIWYEGDGYDPGDEYEVTDAVLRSIRRATKAEAAAAKVQEAEGCAAEMQAQASGHREHSPAVWPTTS